MLSIPLVVLIALSKPPVGWQPDPDHAKVVEQHGRELLPTGMIGDVQVESYAAPTLHGAQLIATSTSVSVVGDGGDWVRARLDELKELPDVGQSAGDQVRVVAWSETPSADGKSVEARLEFADDTIGMVSIVRTIWVRTAANTGSPATSQILEVQGDCEIAADAIATLRAPCEASLASLVVPAADQLQPVSAPAAKPAPDDDTDTDDAPAAASGSGSSSASAVPSMGPASSGDLGPILATRPPEESRDMRPYYVGGALLLLVAVLLWNRKNRRELLAEEARLEKERAEAKKTKEERAKKEAEEDEDTKQETAKAKEKATKKKDAEVEAKADAEPDKKDDDAKPEEPAS
jgi:hypothetical protein